MDKSEIIAQKLKTGLEAARVQVINESHLHQGHRGDDGTGESHFKLIIVSPSFEGVGRVQRHRLVHGILGETAASIHALSIEAYTPTEKPQ